MDETQRMRRKTPHQAIGSVSCAPWPSVTANTVTYSKEASCRVVTRLIEMR